MKKKNKILIACEESQAITKEFRFLGYEAYSCDIQDCSGGHPEWHIQEDALKEAYSGKYKLMVAHPPCTYLAVSGARWMYNKDGSRNEERWKNQQDALDFVRSLLEAPIDYIALENPVSVISSNIRKPDQIIQPYMFGEPYEKKTCLWLKNLPLLKETNLVEPEPRVKYKSGNTLPGWYAKGWGMSKKERSKLRSKTFKGVAEAIANQWSKVL